MTEKAAKRPSFVVEVDQGTHEMLKAVAKHYGASVRGTVVRYIRDGLESEPQTLRDRLARTAGPRRASEPDPL